MWDHQLLLLLQFHKLHKHLNHPLNPYMPPLPQAQPIQPSHVPQINWSHLKPEFVGKPDEDTEVYLLRKNDWMNTSILRWCQSPMILSIISRWKQDYGMNH